MHTTTVQVNQIVSGVSFVYGRVPRERPHRNTPVIVGYAAAYQSAGADDETLDATDPARAESAYLITEIEGSAVRAIRLDASMDYPTTGNPEIIEFTFDKAAAHDRAIESVEVLGTARRAGTIEVGDVISSGRFGESKILKSSVADLPTNQDLFLVLEVSTRPGFGPNPESYGEAKRVRAVRLDGTLSYDSSSAVVEFYISGFFAGDVLIASVVAVGRVTKTRVVVAGDGAETASVSTLATINPAATLGKDVGVGPYADIRAARVGDDSTIGPWASVSDDVVIGPNVTIGARADINRNVLIEDGCLIGTRAFISTRMLIGSSTQIGPDGQLGAQGAIGKNVRIGVRCKFGRQVLIGDNVIIGDDVTIGDYAIIEVDANIGANVKIGAEANVRAGATISPDTKIEAKAIVAKTADGGA